MLPAQGERHAIVVRPFVEDCEARTRHDVVEAPARPPVRIRADGDPYLGADIQAPVEIPPGERAPSGVDSDVVVHCGP
ncbi:MAG: hypothetical protein U0P47_09470 [Acidimicrobiales bacterium]